MNDNIKEHLHILLCEEHFNPLGIVRTLGEYGIKPILIVIKNKRPVVSKSKYIQKIHLVENISSAYNLLLKKYGEESLKPFVYTSDDQVTSLFDNNYEYLKDKFYFFNAHEKNRITYFMNKDNINKLAIKNNLKVAKTWITEVGNIPKDIEFPIITKPIVPTIDNWKSEEVLCKNQEELLKAYKNMKSKNILLQKYIDKKDELAIEGFSVDKGKQVYYTIGINFNYKLEGKYSHYMTVKTFENNEIKRKLNEMFKEICFDGIFEVEFLIDKNDELYFLEINFRPSAWNYSSTVAGRPLPVLWAEATLNNMETKKINNNFKPFTAMSEPDDIRNRVKTHQISFIKWIYDFIKCKCHYYINKKDMNPFWSIINVKVKKK